MKNFLKIFLINVLVLFFLFSLFELGLKLFWRMSTLKGELYVSSKNPNLRYELKPNTSVGQISINSDGFRDREYSIIKPRNSLRILVLGDSETFSKALPLEDTMPKKLESIFNTSCKGKNFEVFNMGTEGYNTIQELELLRYKGLNYNPDLVIVYYCFNDPDYPEYYFRKNFFNRNFLLFRYFQYRIKKALVKRERRIKNIKSEEDNFRYLYTSESWDYTKEAILNIAQLAKKKGFKFVLVVAPEMSSKVADFRDGYPYWYINEKLSQLKNLGIDVVDPIYFFRDRNYDPKYLVISNEDRHKNATANSLISSYLLESFFEKGIITCH